MLSAHAMQFRNLGALTTCLVVLLVDSALAVTSFLLGLLKANLLCICGGKFFLCTFAVNLHRLQLCTLDIAVLRFNPRFTAATGL